MRKDASFRNEYLVNKKVKNDPRITKVGKFLRQSSLDEFPQFINVFLGQMSLVGNRPYLPREVEDMGEYYKYIIASKPGITGLWQTSGRSNTTFYERLVIEKKYSKIQGFRLDIKIIFKTMIQVIKKDGAN
jgi:undecaprenyl-phosphate galactose phosphotransferase